MPAKKSDLQVPSGFTAHDSKKDVATSIQDSLAAQSELPFALLQALALQGLLVKAEPKQNVDLE